MIGAVTTVFADHGQHLYPDGPDRLSNPDLAGGALLDLAVYPISFADFVLGPFTTITATGTLTDRGVDQQESLTVANAAGALGVLHASMLGASAHHPAPPPSVAPTDAWTSPAPSTCPPP
jgi:predicted dehydrogenase